MTTVVQRLEAPESLGSWPSRWCWLCLALGGCGPAPPPATAPDPGEASTRCTQQALLSFDPGSAVDRRILLPPAVQETTSSEQHVVEHPCADHESDDQCGELAEGEAKARYPDAEVTSTVAHQRQLVRLRFEVAGKPVQAAFADQAAALAHLQALQADGKLVVVKSATTIPDNESPRLAVARATLRGPVVQRTVLRLELLLRPPDGDSIGAFKRAQVQANRAGLGIHSWSSDDQGHLRVELGCTMGPD